MEVIARNVVHQIILTMIKCIRKEFSVSELGDIATNKYFNVTNKDLVNDGEYKVTVEL
jgi:hypothetical protein